MPDLPVALSGTWIKSAFVAVVFYDRNLANVVLDPGGRLYFVDGGEKYLSQLATTAPPDRILSTLNPAWTATTLADGAYYVPPPYLFVTPDGWPVPGMRAFPVAVLP